MQQLAAGKHKDRNKLLEHSTLESSGRAVSVCSSSKTLALATCIVCFAGYEHPVDEVVTDLTACLEDSALPLMQFTEVFAVVQVRQSHTVPAAHAQLGAL